MCAGLGASASLTVPSAQLRARRTCHPTLVAWQGLRRLNWPTHLRSKEESVSAARQAGSLPGASLALADCASGTTQAFHRQRAWPAPPPPVGAALRRLLHIRTVSPYMRRRARAGACRRPRGRGRRSVASLALLGSQGWAGGKGAPKASAQARGKLERATDLNCIGAPASLGAGWVPRFRSPYLPGAAAAGATYHTPPKGLLWSLTCKSKVVCGSVLFCSVPFMCLELRSVHAHCALCPSPVCVTTSATESVTRPQSSSPILCAIETSLAPRPPAVQHPPGGPHALSLSASGSSAAATPSGALQSSGQEGHGACVDQSRPLAADKAQLHDPLRLHGVPPIATNRSAAALQACAWLAQPAGRLCLLANRPARPCPRSHASPPPHHLTPQGRAAELSPPRSIQPSG